MGQYHENFLAVGGHFFNCDTCYYIQSLTGYTDPTPMSANDCFSSVLFQD